jgi:hypothetical protein
MDLPPPGGFMQNRKQKTMKATTLNFFLSGHPLLLALALCVLAVGCSSPRSVGIKIGGHEEPGYRVAHKHAGPPPHAPAHGYRKKFAYYYYPTANIYYDRSRHVYFYLSGRDWQMAVSLPSTLRVNVNEAVSLELETDQPYLENAQHVNKVKYKGKGPKQKGRN